MKRTKVNSKMIFIILQSVLLLCLIFCIMLIVKPSAKGLSNNIIHASEISSIDSTKQVAIGKVVYQIDDATNKTAKVFGYQSGLTTATIESQVAINGEDYIVTSIKADALRSCTGLTGVEISSSITSIDDRAFLSCSNLVNVTIPNSVTSMGSGVFFGCKKLKSVIIEDGVTSLGINCFQKCVELSDIIIPDSVTSIGEDAFSGCTGLIHQDDGDPVQYIKTTTNDYFAVYGVSDKEQSLYEINSRAKFILNKAFYMCKNLVEVKIPEGVISIGKEAFDSCKKLESITIPDGVTRINYGTFNWCEGLRNITIPDSVVEVDMSGLRFCSFENVIIGNGIAKDYGTWALDGDGRLTIKVNMEASTTPDWVMANIAELVTSVEWDKNVVFTNIPKRGFAGCSSLRRITIPGSVKTIGEGAFNNCTGLSEVKIPDDVFDIGGSAFEYCKNLKYIKLSNAWNRMTERYPRNEGILKTCLNAYEIYTGNKVYNTPLPASYFVVNDDGTVVDKNGEAVTSNAATNAENGYTSFSGLTNKHLIRADKVEDLFQLTVTSDVEMVEATGYTLSADKKTATKWSLAGSVYGELPGIESEDTEIVYKVGNEVIDVDSGVVAGTVVNIRESVDDTPETGIALDITMIVTSLVLLGATYLVVAHKRKEQK